ncbi:hypothetical protein NFI96_026778 [Prochilodus magdalenae]|nr:hypothetical protein NFI96_026778 [Prochilodus magdalenae]
MNIAETDALLTVNPLLIEKDRMLSEQNPQVPGEGIQEAVSDEELLTRATMAALPPVKEIPQNIAETDVLVTVKPLLTENDQVQSEEQHPHVLSRRTQENIAETDALLTVNPLLIEKDRMLSEQNPQVPGEGIQEAVSDEELLTRATMAALPPVKEIPQ